jgi:hypothetical protein
MGELGDKIRRIVGMEARRRRINGGSSFLSTPVNTTSLYEQKTLNDMNFELFNRIYLEGELNVQQMEIPCIKKSDDKIDLSIIIPVKGREPQLRTSLFFLQKESIKSNLNIKIVVVENDFYPLNKEHSEISGVDYIFIKGRNGGSFNKCLCHNVGSFLHNSNYVMFHDVDLVIPEDFFDKLIKNLGDKKALQCFHNRRVLYLDQALSEKVRSEKSIKSIHLKDPRIREGLSGAPGGSLIIERGLFEKVGGFDPNFFWNYSIEDGFFWKKLEMFTKVYGCDNPVIEMLHLWHEPSHLTNPNIQRDHRIYDAFVHFTDEQRDLFLKMARDNYKKLIENNVK